MVGAWRPRHGRSVRSTLSGLEVPFAGPVKDLMETATSVTLETFGGQEVLVGELERLEVGVWVGRVLKVASGPGSATLGQQVEFSESQVQAVTRTDA